jgi:sulfur-oxidizing protein SoxA
VKVFRELAALVAMILPLWLHPATAETRRSGYATMSPDLQAMQRDDLANPAMLSAAEGERLWNAIPPSAPSCAGCHGAAASAMAGVSVRYPAFDAASGKVLRLSDRIGQCRTERQKLPAWAASSPEPVALESYVALQSRGQKFAPVTDPRLQPALEQGKALFFKRLGQLDLACAQCHDDNAGQRLGGSVIPQGHPTGYPLYRLEWQATGTLSRRIRNCLTGIRAEPFAPDASEMVALELYLRDRAAGMVSDTPAVRP